jgi:hypothetical protein
MKGGRVDSGAGDIVSLDFVKYIQQLAKKKNDTEMKPNKSKTTREKTINKKGYSNVLKGRTDLKYNDGKLTADSEVKVRKGLNPKEKKAIKTSINKEIEKALMNGGKIILDEESDDEFEGGMIRAEDMDEELMRILNESLSGMDMDDRPRPRIDPRYSPDKEKKKRGRSKTPEKEKPDKKGKGLKTNSIMLKHLMEHITDPKEKIDPKDFNHSKMLIDEIKTEKRGRGRPPKYSTQPEPRPIGRPKGTGGKPSKVDIGDYRKKEIEKYRLENIEDNVAKMARLANLGKLNSTQYNDFYFSLSPVDKERFKHLSRIDYGMDEDFRINTYNLLKKKPK